MLLAGPISHTNILYKDFVEIFNASICLLFICLRFILLILVGVELPLCIVVIVVTLSWNAITYFLDSS